MLVKLFHQLRQAVLNSANQRSLRKHAYPLLSLLVKRMHTARDTASLARLIVREIDLALNLEGIAVLLLDPLSDLLDDPLKRTGGLDVYSPLAFLLAESSEPLLTDLDNPGLQVAKLSNADHQWLRDSGFKLLVPIIGRDGSLLGLIGLGRKKSGFRFLYGEREFLRTVATGAGFVFELVRNSSNYAEPVDEAKDALTAKECPDCGVLCRSHMILCAHCSQPLKLSHVPYVLPRRFRFERRIGTGGMGIVYRATDLALGRPVAIKILHSVLPEDVVRLQWEARVAAAVSHSHLATVYGIDIWQGMPLLILELLEGGTLTKRLERGPMTPLDTIELGITMADALALLHSVGILHHDIKPSNIGFTHNGIPKLMDFGIARYVPDRDLLSLSSAGEEEESLVPSTLPWPTTPIPMSLSKEVLGTLSYLSPEVLAGKPAERSRDLWSLVIVLYECLLRRKVFRGNDPMQVMARIKEACVPEPLKVIPDANVDLAAFFRAALHKDPACRPSTAQELKEMLQALRSQLVI